MENKGVIAVVTLVVMFILALFIWPVTSVAPAHRGVVIKFGQIQNETLFEGWHIINPFSSVYDMDIRTQKEEIESAAASKDLQNVSTKVAINYKLDQDKVAQLYKEIGKDYSEVLIAPAVQESIKAATAKFTADELITKREVVKEEILNSLKQRMEGKYIVMENVSITNFQFSESFNKSIEAKVTAEQDALAAKNKLAQVKFEAEQRVAQAQAEAEAIKIQAQAVTSQGGADYVKLKWVEKWNGSLPSTMLGENTPIIGLK